jgi:trk system potassium uptake protein TrkH
MYIGGIVKLTKKIVVGTAIIELIGAILLSTRYIPLLGVPDGIFNSIFLSISAFCNAGFDLNGRFVPSSSMTSEYFNSDPVIILTLCALITLGAIGFFVWDDVTTNKWHFSQYRLHSKLAISVTFFMTLIGTPLFLIFEYHNTLEGMPMWQKILCSLFSVVTPRTAGFEIVSSGDLKPSSTILSILYLVVGGSSGSTAGGAKTTTIAVIFISMLNSLKGESSLNVFGRRLQEDALKRACSVLTVNVSLALVGSLIVSAFQPELSLNSVLFETFSAINTVGMTMGITSNLCGVSLVVVAFLMFLGRVGSLSFALVFTEKVQGFKSAQNPVEEINIG